MATKSAAPKMPAVAPRTTASEEGTHRATHPLCADNHLALKSHEATWQAAPFSGYQPLGHQLGELRTCMVCKSTVLRFISYTVALRELLEHLVRSQPNDDVYFQSAQILMSWTQLNIPRELGLAAEDPQPPDLLMLDRSGDWQELGRDLRKRRESLGLSRAQLGQLVGVADSTIRNLETGRHRPSDRTLRRICSVPALRSR